MLSELFPFHYSHPKIRRNLNLYQILQLFNNEPGLSMANYQYGYFLVIKSKFKSSRERAAAAADY